MTKTIVLILAVSVCFLLLWADIQSKRIDSLKDAKNTLQANNELLIKNIRRSYNDKMEISRKYEELEKMAKSDSYFDWNHDISHTDVVKFLHENSNRVQGIRTRTD